MRLETIYIYALIDPNTEQIRYIGQSRQPEERLIQHFQAKENPAKYRWLRRLRQDGQEPKIDIIGEANGSQEALDLEKKLIGEMLDQGIPLLNMKLTGPNGTSPFPLETIEKLKAAWKHRKAKEPKSSCRFRKRPRPKCPKQMKVTIRLPDEHIIWAIEHLEAVGEEWADSIARALREAREREND